MTTATAPELTPAERTRLSRIADVVFPRTDQMPSASDAHVSEKLVDRVLAAVPSLGKQLRRALAAAEGDPNDALVVLREREPLAFKTLFLVLASAYYMAPEVEERTGYHGQEARTIDVFELPSYLEDGTLDRVIERGQRWVDASS